MKTITLALALALNSLVFGQTNIISLKSHAGQVSDLALEKDNFGEMSMPRFYVDSVIFVKPGVLVESKHTFDFVDFESGAKQIQFYDTILDPSITNTITYSLRQQYGSNVVFVGFKKDKVNQVNPYFEGMKKNGANTFLMFVELLLFIGFIRRYRLSNA